MKLRWHFSVDFSIQVTKEGNLLLSFIFSNFLAALFYVAKNIAKVYCSVASVECWISAADQRNIVTTVPKNVHPWWIESKRSTEISLAASYIFCQYWVTICRSSPSERKVLSIFFFLISPTSSVYTPILFFLPGDLIDFPCCCGLLFSSPLSPCFVWSGKWGVVGWKGGGDRKLAIQQTWATVERNYLINQANISMHPLSKRFFHLFFVLWVAHIKQASILQNSL